MKEYRKRKEVERKLLNKRGKVEVSFDIPKVLYNQLVELAKEKKMSMDELIEHIISEYLEQNETKETND